MCQANVFVERAGRRELVMSDVIHLRVEGETVWLSRFFEEPVAIRGTIREADFLKHTVILEPVSESA